MDIVWDIQLGKSHADAALFRLRLHHGLAFGNDLAKDTDSGDNDIFPDSTTARSRTSLINLSKCQPACRIWQCSPSGRPSATGGGLQQLGETEDRIERAAKLMAHAGKEIRFREIGFFRRGLGALQFDVSFLECNSKRLRSVTSRAAANTPCSFRSRS